jgi:hypothetical protein
MNLRWSAIAVSALFTACTVTSVPTATSPAATSPVRESSPSPGPSDPPGSVLQTSPVGTLPADFRLIATANRQATTVWLVDLAGGDLSPLATVIYPKDDPVLYWPAAGFGASRDGRTLIIEVPSRPSRSALHLIRTETGESSVLHDDPKVHAASPLVSADGSRFAFVVHGLTDSQRKPGSISIRSASDGTTTEIYQDDSGHSLRLMGWSTDGRHLAFSIVFEGCGVSVAHVPARAIREVGEGCSVDWRAQHPQLLMAKAGCVFSLGSSIYTYDVLTGVSRTLHSSTTKYFGPARWHPAGERFLYLESVGDCMGGPPGNALFVRQADGGRPERIPAPTQISDAWWSRDGSAVYALVEEFGSPPTVVAVPSGHRIATLCAASSAFPCP